MRQFNVLVKCWYQNGYINSFVLPVNATDELAAEQTADEIIQSSVFSKVIEYELLEVSQNPFYLKKWIVKATVTHESHPQKQIFQYFKVGAVNEMSARELATEIAQNRKGVTQVTIVGASMIQEG